jgi:hypothetical protein
VSQLYWRTKDAAQFLEHKTGFKFSTRKGVDGGLVWDIHSWSLNKKTLITTEKIVEIPAADIEAIASNHGWESCQEARRWQVEKKKFEIASRLLRAHGFTIARGWEGNKLSFKGRPVFYEEVEDHRVVSTCLGYFRAKREAAA